MPKPPPPVPEHRFYPQPPLLHEPYAASDAASDHKDAGLPSFNPASSYDASHPASAGAYGAYTSPSMFPSPSAPPMPSAPGNCSLPSRAPSSATHASYNAPYSALAAGGVNEPPPPPYADQPIFCPRADHPDAPPPPPYVSVPEQLERVQHIAGEAANRLGFAGRNALKIGAILGALVWTGPLIMFALEMPVTLTVGLAFLAVTGVCIAGGALIRSMNMLAKSTSLDEMRAQLRNQYDALEPLSWEYKEIAELRHDTKKALDRLEGGWGEATKEALGAFAAIIAVLGCLFTALYVLKSRSKGAADNRDNNRDNHHGRRGDHHDHHPQVHVRQHNVNIPWSSILLPILRCYNPWPSRMAVPEYSLPPLIVLQSAHYGCCRPGNIVYIPNYPRGFYESPYYAGYTHRYFYY